MSDLAKALDAIKALSALSPQTRDEVIAHVQGTAPKKRGPVPGAPRAPRASAGEFNAVFEAVKEVLARHPEGLTLEQLKDEVSFDAKLLKKTMNWVRNKKLLDLGGGSTKGRRYMLKKRQMTLPTEPEPEPPLESLPRKQFAHPPLRGRPKKSSKA